MFSASSAPASEESKLHEAIKQAFRRMDEEIIQAAVHSDVAECKVGGTTALMALICGRVRRNHTRMCCVYC